MLRRAPHHHVADPSAEDLRKALNEVSALIPSGDGILNAASKAGYPVQITRNGLGDFMKGLTKALKPENREPLEKFLFRSPLGRALRNPSLQRESNLDPLIEVLSSGRSQKPNDYDGTGWYFLYHGSYMRPGHFVIRVLEIRRAEKNTLLVIDSLRDNKTVHSPLIEAFGCLTFFGDTAQILVETSDNRVGLSLFVASQVWWSPENKLIGLFGQLSGLNNGKNAFSRHCLILRAAEGQEESGFDQTPEERGGSVDNLRSKLIQQSGLFTLENLQGRHRKAIDTLADIVAPEHIKDPILQHPKIPKGMY
jgi:hypothetical protein